MGRDGYQDDTQLFTKAGVLADCWPNVHAALARFAMTWKTPVCQPRPARAQFETEAIVDDQHVAALARRVAEFKVTQPRIAAIHLAWTLLSKFGARFRAQAPSFGARLVPSTAPGAVAEPVTSSVREVFQHDAAARRSDEHALGQLRPAGALGGRDLCPEVEQRVAAAALWASPGVHGAPRPPRLAGGLGMAQWRLEQVGGQGGVKSTPGICGECSSGPWVQHVAIDEPGALKLILEASCVFNYLDALEARRLWRAHGAEGQTEMLSAGGPSVCAMWSQMPASLCEYFPTSYFRS
ncbi:unnamed protein product, partial [Prorocentrum cordatum]